MKKLLVLTKRQYMNRDLIDDRFGRFREIPLALGKMGYRVNGLCLSYQKRQEGIIVDGPVHWNSVNATLSKIPGLVRFTLAAIKLSKKHDIIWACSDSIYGIIASKIGSILKKPVIFDIYDNFEGFLLGRLPLMRQLYYQAIRNCSAVTTIGDPFSKDILNRRLRSDQIYTIESAVDHRLFRPLDKKSCRMQFNLPQNAHIIGTAGALYKIRDVDLLLKAFNQLKSKYSNLHLAVAGPRDGQIDFSNDIRIHDAGHLPQERVPAFLNALDTAVICYRDDKFGKTCFPQKTYEIMACNVPLVAADVGSLSGLFVNRRDWLYSPGCLDSLSHAIENRIKDRTTGYIKTPTWEHAARKLHTVIQGLNDRAPS